MWQRRGGGDGSGGSDSGSDSGGNSSSTTTTSGSRSYKSDSVAGAHLLGVLDKLIPRLEGFTHFVLRNKEPVVRFHQQVVATLEARKILGSTLHQRVLDALDGDLVREFLAHHIHVVDRDTLGPHAEHQRRRLHRSLDLLHHSTLLGDSGSRAHADSA